MLGDGLRSSERQWIRRSEGRVVEGECAPRFRGTRVQPPRETFDGTLTSLIDARQDPVVGEVEQCLGLLSVQAQVRDAHANTRYELAPTAPGLPTQTRGAFGDRIGHTAGCANSDS